ncbi:SIR2 family protein [Marinospirillum perlucidum]|uniref:SIR2 family protein n=1 Tax=Marinospirillum perlucidum TaxID=1982602 RepID=UPI000DF20E5D|nr:SIR2 family protein [Marinospirillum perlucidum]
MTQPLPTSLLEAWDAGRCVPVLGHQALEGITDKDGNAMPADSDSLIIAMNQGRPMAPKLMYEFPRAAMNIELKRGRKAVTRFLDTTYRDTEWSQSDLHQKISQAGLDYVIDLNRDTQIQDHWQKTPHLLVVGVARIGGGTERYRLFQHDGQSYQAVDLENADSSLPILFKPVGTPLPESLYVASDADYVDYLTELMGGFGMPPFLKQKRKGMQYLLLGLRLDRDTPRMLINDIVYDAGNPAGWACIEDPTPKEAKFLERQGFEILNLNHDDCLNALLAEVSAHA